MRVFFINRQGTTITKYKRDDLCFPCIFEIQSFDRFIRLNHPLFLTVICPGCQELHLLLASIYTKETSFVTTKIKMQFLTEPV
ncbi:MAG TPA: hypothetical protein DCK76_08775 [Desulfotomaculum sp.]|nr:hypothetical protein [Desulfotomaculum sp.]HBY03225.1 hypothetical protein [Desulfotomaculum sp.]